MLDYFKSLRPYRRIRTAMLLLAIIIFAAILNCFRAIANDDYENKRYKFVGTQYGKIRGHSVNSGDGEYLAFLGIPYAAPPVGNNRFKNPKPPHSWEGIYDATRKSKCPQKGEGEEDCLILNIFTPLVGTSSLVPVLVYIHGGSFIMGAGPTAGMEYLISQNIIVVTFNYRLGAPGFLCLGIAQAPGNAGLKDQVAALKYVKDNIENFGGDPAKVTIYGMSAGGASVEYLILSKMSQNLFHRAIIESASATTPWALDRNPVKTAHNVAELLDIPYTDFLMILVEHFVRTDIEMLTDSTFEYYSNLTDGTFGFVPCVEKKLNGPEPFITERPDEILKSGNFKRVPTMFLFSELEGLYLRSSEYRENNYKERMESNFLDFLPADLIFDNDAVKNETARYIQRFYFGNGSDIIRYLNYFGDSLILHGLLNSVQLHAKSCNVVYLLEFAYKGDIGGHDKFYVNINQAGHGDAVKYAILNNRPTTESDKITVRRVSRLLANYVKYGNPTPALNPLLPIRWPPVTSYNFTYLYLGDKFEVRSEPYPARKNFWDWVYATTSLYKSGLGKR